VALRTVGSNQLPPVPEVRLAIALLFTPAAPMALDIFVGRACARADHDQRRPLLI
jgi:hypothetical protein